MPSLPTEDYYVHPSSLVETCDVGAGTTIWAFVHLLPGVRVGQIGRAHV